MHQRWTIPPCVRPDVLIVDLHSPWQGKEPTWWWFARGFVSLLRVFFMRCKYCFFCKHGINALKNNIDLFSALLGPPPKANALLFPIRWYAAQSFSAVIDEICPTRNWSYFRATLSGCWKNILIVFPRGTRRGSQFDEMRFSSPHVFRGSLHCMA